MEYSAGIISTLLWWSETQQVARLVQEHNTREDILRLATEDNIFHVRSMDRRRRIAGVTYKRLQALPQEMAAYLGPADFRTAQIIVILSVMVTERIFKEFCEEILYEAIRVQSFMVTDEAVSAFMQRKINQSAKVAGFSDSAMRKLKQTCIKFLYDGGLVASTKGKRNILYPMVTPDFPDLCQRCGMAPYYRILIGSSV